MCLTRVRKVLCLANMYHLGFPPLFFLFSSSGILKLSFPRPVASLLLGNTLKMCIFRPLPQTYLNHKLQRRGPAIYAFFKSSIQAIQMDAQKNLVNFLIWSIKIVFKPSCTSELVERKTKLLPTSQNLLKIMVVRK